ALLPTLEGEQRLLLTADQVVTFRGAIREKPKDLAEAEAFLRSYAGDCCRTVGALCLHDAAADLRMVGTQKAEVHFAPELAEEDVLRGILSEEVLNCAGALMVEHPVVQENVEKVEGGLDSVMGLSLQLLEDLQERLEAWRGRLARFGPVLGRPLRRWAVVGDVLNPAKPAARVARRLEEAGRTVLKVSPYDKTGACFGKLEDVPEVDALNLIISPKLGEEVLEDAKKLGIRYVFIQPGADAEFVVRRAATHLIAELSPSLGLSTRISGTLLGEMEI
ncbi:unnamed protein product, partial [Effrenium voratum]